MHLSRRFHYQHKFSVMLARLIRFAADRGYWVITGEVQRSKEQAKANAKSGVGIEKSLHTICMAVDISLRSPSGIYLEANDDYTEVGEYWESLGGNWGGRWGDGNHFSISYPHEGFEGVK
jgi:hypothetical protein